MLKRILLSTCLSFCLSTAAFAQIEDIKGLAENYSSSSSDFTMDEVWLFDLFIDFFWLGIDYHMWQLERSGDIPKVISVDVLSKVGVGKQGLLMLSPRIRGNFGLFATDFRYNVLANDGVFSTLDWQIVTLNIVNAKHLTMRLGTGIMHERDENNTFTEHTLGIDVLVPNSNFLVNVEGRLASNYFEATTARIETNAHVAYKTMSFDHAAIYIMGGATWQRYYGQVDIWAIQTGLLLNIQ